MTSNQEMSEVKCSQPATVKPWPINRNALKSLREAALTALDSLIAGKQNADISDLCLNAFMVLYPHWASDLMWVVYASMVKQAKEKNPELALDPAGFPRICAYIGGGEMPASRYMNILVDGPPTASKWRWAGRGVKNIFIPSGLVRRHIHYFSKLPNDAPVILGLSSLAEDHAHAENKHIYLVESECWFGPIQPSQDPNLTALAGEVRNCLLDVLRQGAIPLDDSLQKWLSDSVEKGLRLVAAHHENLNDLPVPQELWIGSASAAWPRILAFEVQRRGGRVIAHDHGSGAASCQDTGPQLLISGISDQFVTFTDACATATREKFAKRAFAVPKKTEVVSLSKNLPARTKDTVVGKARTKHPPLRHIVYIPLSCTGEIFNLIPHPDDVPAADFNRRVVTALMEEGFRVTAKPHPMSSTDTNEKLAAATGCKIETRPFEQIEKDFDAVIFTTPFTSIFSYVLKLNMPVVLLDIGSANYTKTWFNLLSNRVGIVPIGMDAGNHLLADKNLLISILRKAQQRASDTTFSRAFYSNSDV